MKHFHHALSAAFVGLNPHLDCRPSWKEIVSTRLEDIEVQKSVAEVLVEFDEAKPLCGIEPTYPPCWG